MLSRREFLLGSAALAGASALVVAGCAGGSGRVAPTGTPFRWLRVSTAGLIRDEPRWAELETASSPSSTTAGDRTPGASAAAGRAGTWLVLESDGSVVAFVPACTHQRCFYDWDEASTRFACRCHQGFFAVDGRVISGPPPRPLDRFATRPDGPDAIEIGWPDGA